MTWVAMARRRSRNEDDVSLDAEFVQAAAVVELSADQREAKRGRERLELEIDAIQRMVDDAINMDW